MRTIVPARGFVGYPNGKRRHFAAGEPVPVSDEYAALLEKKGDLVAFEDEAAEPKNKGRAAKARAADETGSAEPATPNTDPEPAE